MEKDQYIYIYLYHPNPLKITGFTQNPGSCIEPFKKKGLFPKTSGFGKYLKYTMISSPVLSPGAADAWDQAAGEAAQDLVAFLYIKYTIHKLYSLTKYL